MLKQRGFVGIILLIIIALVVLKYLYNFSVFDAAGTPQGQNTVQYTEQLFGTLWSYIRVPVTLAWERVVWPILDLSWSNFQAFIQWGQQNASTGVQ